jgi:hypothetical protein
MIIRRRLVIFISGLLIILSAGCNKNPYNVDISGVKYNLVIKDLEGDIFNTPPARLPLILDSIKGKYGDIITTYSRALGLDDPNNPQWNKEFVTFATDLSNVEIRDEVKKVWPSQEPLRETLEKAFRHYLYYFPKAEVPRVVTCITAFNNSLIVDDSLLMISLDRYLGAGSKYYPSMGIFGYQSRRMTPAYVVSDCMYGWASTEWDSRDMNYDARNLLVSMIHEGKLVYFTRCMVPETPDTVLFGFTKKQMDFCNDNEKRIWEYLVSHDLLFSTDGFMIRKFTGEAPFTSYFTEESPGRAVVWSGFRIVESYMRNNPGVSLKDLMAMTDCQAILSGAKYKP